MNNPTCDKARIAENLVSVLMKKLEKDSREYNGGNICYPYITGALSTHLELALAKLSKKELGILSKEYKG